MIADDYVDHGVRHRRGQDHAGARPERLRDRPAAQPAQSSPCWTRRRDHRERRPFAGAGPLRGPPGRRGRRYASRAGSWPRTEPYLHAVGHCQRGGEIVEPRCREQWFVQIEPLAKAAGRRRARRPDPHICRSMAARYFNWLENIHDWCISRQLWWGHRIPVWYCPNGEMTRARRPDSMPPCGSTGLAPGPGRAGYLVLVGPVAVLHAGLAGGDAGPASTSTRPPCWRPATTSCSSGSRA